MLFGSDCNNNMLWDVTGVKRGDTVGVGKAPLIPPLAAVANAVYQATGVRMDRLALSPGNVLEALQARRS